MPAAIREARTEFSRAIVDAENLVAIHRELRSGPGRRVREVTINRAIVVITVAAWQAYVQDVARAALQLLDPGQGQPGRGLFTLVRIATESGVSRFSTPNAENVRDLLSNVGFDPWPAWTWQSGPQHYSSADVRARVNQWLRVRHSIAHGDELPPAAVLDTTSAGNPTLRLQNAEGCIRFFKRLVEVTTAAADSAFGTP